MTADLVKTSNGTYVTKEVAEAAGLDVPKVTRKRKSTAKAPAKRKAPARSAAKRKAATTRKGKA